MNRVFKILCAVMAAVLLCGCTPREDDGKLKVVAVNFAAYDFARAVLGDTASLSMLLDPGVEVHSFEPSPDDIAAVGDADVFIYTGGESDIWVEKILRSNENDKRITVNMIESSAVLCYEHEHSEDTDGDHDHSDRDGSCNPDEHVWMSPDNAYSIIGAVCDAICKADPENSASYRLNAENYRAEITAQAAKTTETIKKSGCDRLVVADRFPLKYFCRYYSLKYTAAFDACDTFADADAATVISLIDAVKEDTLSHVFYISGGSGYLAETVCREAGCKPLALNALHSVTSDEFISGMTYVDVMKFNRLQLERGLSHAAN